MNAKKKKGNFYQSIYTGFHAKGWKSGGYRKKLREKRMEGHEGITFADVMFHMLERKNWERRCESRIKQGAGT